MFASIPAVFALAIAFLSPIASAQGADDCFQAQPISGVGSFAVDLQNTTPSGVDPQGCTGLSSFDDVWFDWTAPNTGLFGVEVCGGNTDRWAIGVWDDCWQNAIACADFNCRFNDNRVVFSAVGGTHYKVQVSSRFFWAQGTMTILSVSLPTNDSCSDATAWEAYGEVPFDLTDATTTGPTTTQCQNTVFDLWIRWTSPYAWPAEVLCSAPNVNLALFDACGGQELQCHTASSLEPARLQIDPQAGEEFLIRISTRLTAERTIGSIRFVPNEIVIDRSTKRAYFLIKRPMTYAAARVYAQSIRYRGASGHLATLTTQAEHDLVYSLFPAGDINFAGIGLFQDLADPNYSEPAGAWKWVTGEPLQFTNWLPTNRPDNSFGLEHYGTILFGYWDDVREDISRYLLEWPIDPVGTEFCGPAEANSIGLSTKLFAEGSSISPAQLRLEGADGPPGQIGYLLIGPVSMDPGVVAGNGRLCLSASASQPIGRYNVAGTQRNSVGLFDQFGILKNLVGTSSTGTGYELSLHLPIAGGGVIAPGQTWHFQLTHREPGGAFNFSNGVSVTF